MMMLREQLQQEALALGTELEDLEVTRSQMPNQSEEAHQIIDQLKDQVVRRLDLLDTLIRLQTQS